MIDCEYCGKELMQCRSCWQEIPTDAEVCPSPTCHYPYTVNQWKAGGAGLWVVIIGFIWSLAMLQIELMRPGGGEVVGKYIFIKLLFFRLAVQYSA
jgi:hypothetical protein